MGIFDYDEKTPGFQTPRDSISLDSLLGLKGPNISLDDEGDDDEGVVDLTTDSLENINVGGGIGQDGYTGPDNFHDIISNQDFIDITDKSEKESMNANIGKLGKAILGGLPGMVSLGLDILSDGKIKAPTSILGTIVGTIQDGWDKWGPQNPNAATSTPAPTTQDSDFSFDNDFESGQDIDVGIPGGIAAPPDQTTGRSVTTSGGVIDSTIDLSDTDMSQAEVDATAGRTGSNLGFAEGLGFGNTPDADRLSLGGMVEANPLEFALGGDVPTQDPRLEPIAVPQQVADPNAAPGAAKADDVPLQLEEGDFVLSRDAIRIAGKEDIENMVKKAIDFARSKGHPIVNSFPSNVDPVDVLVHNDEIVIPSALAEIIGMDRLEKINNRAKEKQQATQEQEAQAQAQVPQQRASGGKVSPPLPMERPDKRFMFLSRVEDSHAKAYDDKTGKPITDPSKVKGNPTIGIGFNLNRSDASQVFESVLGIPAQEFQSYKTGTKDLKDDQIKDLFNFTIIDSEKILSSMVPVAGLNDNQRLALTSLTFNSPELIGKNLRKQINERDFDGAINEILYKSNKRKDKGLASRRYEEALLFAGGKLPISKEDYLKQF